MIALLLVAVLSIPLSTLVVNVGSVRHVSVAFGALLSGGVLAYIGFAASCLGNPGFAEMAGNLSVAMAAVACVAGVIQRVAVNWFVELKRSRTSGVFAK